MCKCEERMKRARKKSNWNRPNGRVLIAYRQRAVFTENVTEKTTVTRRSRVNRTGLSNNGSNFRKRKFTLIFLPSGFPGSQLIRTISIRVPDTGGKRVPGPSVRSPLIFVADLSNRSDFSARRLTSTAELRARPFLSAYVVLPPDDFLQPKVLPGFQMFFRQYTIPVAAVRARRDGCTDECEEQHGRRRNGHTARIVCIGRINTQPPPPPPLRAGNKSQTSKCNSTIALLGPIRARTPRTPLSANTSSYFSLLNVLQINTTFPVVRRWITAEKKKKNPMTKRGIEWTLRENRYTFPRARVPYYKYIYT